MEQRSDVQFRAEKEYKNRKEKFFRILNEENINNFDYGVKT